MKAGHLIALAACLGSLGPPSAAAPAPEDPPTMDAAQRMLDRERWDDAIAAYQARIAADAQDGMSWYLLAYAKHRSGDVQGAVETNLKGLDHGAPRGATLFNLACGYEVLGRVDEAEETLGRAIRAGYLDFDLIAGDPELAQVRARGNVGLPTRHAFRTFEAPNRVELPYELILPEGHDPKRPTPAVVLFSPAHGPLAASWSIQTLCDGITRRLGCMVLVVVAPERGWWTHPTHHALEDLFDEVRDEHAVDGKLHLVGFLGGAHPARTYAGMSRKYFQSLTVIGGEPFAGREDRAVTSHEGLRCAFVMGEEEPGALAEAERAVRLLKGAGGEARLRVLEGEGGSLPGLHHGEWLRVVLEELGLGSG